MRNQATRLNFTQFRLNSYDDHFFTCNRHTILLSCCFFHNLAWDGDFLFTQKNIFQLFSDVRITHCLALVFFVVALTKSLQQLFAYKKLIENEVDVRGQHPSSFNEVLSFTHFFCRITKYLSAFQQHLFAIVWSSKISATYVHLLCLYRELHPFVNLFGIKISYLFQKLIEWPCNIQ